MPTTRTCCCSVTELGEPVLVRAGWYHFLVLTKSGGVSCLIGNPTRVANHDKTYYSYTPGNIPNPRTTSWCSDFADVIEAPAGHPLRVPAGIKSASQQGGAVKDITCGAYHNIVRMQDNTIKAWGLNAVGQCNVPTSSSKGDLTDPANPNLSRIVGLHAGYTNSAVTFNDGSVVCWGDPVVANDVNSWSNLMMSPVSSTPSFGRYDETDNVATDNQKFAKPYYPAAYDSSISETWNVLQDPTSKWHGANAPNPRWGLDRDTHACVPFFDLGCETDPHHPLEFKAEGQIDYTEKFPGVGTKFPMNWIDYNMSPPCYNEAGCIDHPERFGDWLSMQWRTKLLFQQNYGNPKSCCDLTIKRDFAIGLRRTGQIVSCRRPDAGGSNPNKSTYCPPSNTTCRDCSADKLQSIRLGNAYNPRAGCYKPGGSTPADHLDTVNAASCPCTDATVVDDNTPGTYYQTGCPTCPADYCPADRRFVINSPECSSTSYRFHEGIGCMSVGLLTEELVYDPNWAKNYAQSIMSPSMYDAGEQVRYKPSTANGVWPDVNGQIRENWGWSTKPTADIVLSQNTTCVVAHNANSLTNNPFCAPGEDANGNSYCPGGSMTRLCKSICKSSTAAEYEFADITPEGIAAWQYPVQFFSNGVVAGTNTTTWVSVPLAIRNMFPSECPCNTTIEHACYDGRFQTDDVSKGSSGGFVTHGCIYAGLLPSSLGRSFDKYNHYNSYVGETGWSKDGCNPSASLKLNSSYYFKGPSKPWGPYQFVMTNGFGELDVEGAKQCHCATEYPGSLDVPYLYCPGMGAYEFHNMLRIWGADSQIYDTQFGTRGAFPRERNLSCQHNPFFGRTSSSDLSQAGCDSSCGPQSAMAADQRYGSYPAFCMHNPVISYASSRMAFAIIKGDHRREENNVRVTPDFTHNYPPRHIGGDTIFTDPYNQDGSELVDPSQHPGCECTTGGTGPYGGQYLNCTPYVAPEWVVHIWGSLWDPCPPWPRLCDNETISKPVVNPPNGCATEWSGYTDLETTQSSPEMNWTPADELDPQTSMGWGPCALYPSWTRLPANPEPGASRIYFSSRKGKWRQTGGQWDWVYLEEGGCEPSVGYTMYCPSCSEWAQKPPTEKYFDQNRVDFINFFGNDAF